MSPIKTIRELYFRVDEYARRKTVLPKGKIMKINLIYNGKNIIENINKTLEDVFGELDIVSL